MDPRPKQQVNALLRCEPNDIVARCRRCKGGSPCGEPFAQQLVARRGERGRRGLQLGRLHDKGDDQLMRRLRCRERAREPQQRLKVVEGPRNDEQRSTRWCGRPRGPRTLCVGRQAKRRVVPQGRLLELLQLLARLQADLLRKVAPSRTVGGEGLGLAGRSVKGKHQLVSQTLAAGMLDHERLKLADQLTMAPGC